MRTEELADNCLSGQRYKATTPDTLDLSERAEYAINAMTGMLDAKRDYEYIWWVHLVPLFCTTQPHGGTRTLEQDGDSP